MMADEELQSVKNRIEMIEGCLFALMEELRTGLNGCYCSWRFIQHWRRRLYPEADQTNVSTGEDTTSVKEADLYAPICDGAAKDGLRLFKIEDGGRMKKPFDIVGVDDCGGAVAIEVKVVDKELDLDDLLPRRLFETQQIEWLSDWAQRGAAALVALYEEPTCHLWVFRLESPGDWDRPMKEVWNTVIPRVDGVFRGWSFFGFPVQNQ